MGVLIVAGTVTLVALIVQRAGGGAEAVGVQHLGQPPGTRMLGVSTVDGRLAVLVARPDGERVVFYDVRRGRVVGELRPGE